MTIESDNEFLGLFDRVANILGDEKAATWWDTPNPHLGEVRPITMFYSGEKKKARLLKFIEEAEEFNLYER